MNTAIFAFTARGRQTACRVRDCMARDGDTATIFVPMRLSGNGFEAIEGDLARFTAGVFNLDALVFVGACGIAVRAIAPHVTSKLSDPAVLCVDEGSRFVIPLLSGHIGGANRLARLLAGALGATPVITTATDINGRFSVDAWASQRQMHICDMALAKRVSARILTREVPICADRPLPKELPNGLVSGASGDLGICVSIYDKHPFEDTLLLVPAALRLGIGCRRGIAARRISETVDRVFAEHSLNLSAVDGAASIDIKSGEEGLKEFCALRGWPIRFYSAEQLKRVRGSVSGSEFVERTVGVDCVCERAALAEGGRLIVPKTAFDGVTVAVAEREWEVDFDDDPRGGHWPG